jgi:hypothetical protein
MTDIQWKLLATPMWPEGSGAPWPLIDRHLDEIYASPRGEAGWLPLSFFKAMLLATSYGFSGKLEIAPMLVSTAIAAGDTAGSRAIPSMRTAASRKSPPAPPQARGKV